MSDSNRPDPEYLCDACQKLWSVYLTTLDTHGPECMFASKEYGEWISRQPRSLYSRGYCTCEHGHEYKSSRTKATNETIENLTCPLCAFIWCTTDSLRMKVSSQSAADSSTRRSEDVVEFTIVFRAPYQRSIFKIEALGQLHFRLYETVHNLRSGTAQFQTGSDDIGVKHWSWLSAPLNDNSFFTKQGHFIATQIEQCQRHHPACRMSSTSTPPSRLLQLSGSPEDPQVRLVDTVTVQPYPQYCALSYCWGPNQPLVTRNENLTQHLHGIDVRRISATVLDTIRLTLSVGITHLWVDAFCILQDSDDDKNVELARMAGIYEGAVCTFSIASARSCLDGFRSSATTCERMIFEPARGARSLIEFCSDANNDLANEPIHQRGWTLQETLISPRLVTVLSNGRGTQIRCRTKFWTSDGCEIVRAPRLLEYGSSAASHDYFKEQQTQLPWFDIAMEYSKRSFSYREDKFPALSAIARVYEDSGELGSYVAGVFTGALSWDLMWSSQNTRNRLTPSSEDESPRQAEQTWIAPSWSWASRNHPIHYTAITISERSMFESSQCILDVQLDVEPVSSLLPRGKLKKAILKVRCYSWKLVWGEYNILARIFLDDYPCSLETGDEIWFVHVANEEGYDNALSNGLILKEVHNSNVPVDDAIGVFKRVGMYLYGPRSYFIHHKEIIPQPFDGFQKEIKIIKPNTFKII